VNRYQTLQITVQDEDEESLGSCSVDAADIIKEFVLAGAGFLHEIVKDKVRQQLKRNICHGTQYEHP
jgi:hypothetical protein